MLRAAGAVILGKTAVPELCLWPFTETVTFGATRNPWDPTRTPGGSSGGTGAAIAAGLAGVGLGSDGAGSIRIPATWCGLFGIKPQRDRVPLAPHDNAWYGLKCQRAARTHGRGRGTVPRCHLDTPVPDGGFVGASARPPARLRIAMSAKVPPPLVARVGAAAASGPAEAAACCGIWGTTSSTAIPTIRRRPPDGLAPRYMRGTQDELRAMPSRTGWRPEPAG